MNAFEPSTCAAAALGPKMRSPASVNRSAMPATSGASGPTTVRSTECSCAHASRPSMSSARTETFSTRGSRAVPALPGATSTRATRSLCASFQASACSRPPPPTTSTVSGSFEDDEIPESVAWFTSSSTAVQCGVCNSPRSPMFLPDRTPASSKTVGAASRLALRHSPTDEPSPTPCGGGVDPPLPELRATEFYPSPLKPRPEWTHRRARPQSPAPCVWQPRRSNEPRREFRRLFV